MAHERNSVGSPAPWASHHRGVSSLGLWCRMARRAPSSENKTSLFSMCMCGIGEGASARRANGAGMPLLPLPSVTPPHAHSPVTLTAAKSLSKTELRKHTEKDNHNPNKQGMSERHSSMLKCLSEPYKTYVRFSSTCLINYEPMSQTLIICRLHKSILRWHVCEQVVSVHERKHWNLRLGRELLICGSCCSVSVHWQQSPGLRLKIWLTITLKQRCKEHLFSITSSLRDYNHQCTPERLKNLKHLWLILSAKKQKSKSINHS